MTVTVTAPQQTALEGRTVSMAMFAFMDFHASGGGPIRVSTWNTNLTWGGFTWNGLGNLVSVQDVKESEKLETQAVDLTLNAANYNILYSAITLDYYYRGRNIVLYMCPMLDGALIDTPITVWGGYMDTVTITYATEGGSIVMRCQPTAAKLSRPNGMRVNAQQQKLTYPTDLGFDYQADLIANPQVWATKRAQEVVGR